MKSTFIYLFYASVVIVGIMIISGCAEVTNIDACRVEKPSGFFRGLIHGCLTPFSFLVSLFFEKVAVYDINNSGGWYDFGFLIGSGILFGGGARSIKKK